MACWNTACKSAGLPRKLTSLTSRQHILAKLNFGLFYYNYVIMDRRIQKSKRKTNTHKWKERTNTRKTAPTKCFGKSTKTRVLGLLNVNWWHQNVRGRPVIFTSRALGPPPPPTPRNPHPGDLSVFGSAEKVNIIVSGHSASSG